MDYPNRNQPLFNRTCCLIKKSYRANCLARINSEAGSDEEFARLLFYAPFVSFPIDTAADPVF